MNCARLLLLLAAADESFGLMLPTSPAAHALARPSAACLRQGHALLCAPCGQMPSPDTAACAALEDAKPSPALQPREVILALMHALHKKNLDSPRARFGCEVVLRFLAPENPASRATPQRFAEYLAQPWYLPLLEWSQFRWEGETVLLSNGQEAYQQVGVRSGSGEDDEWTNVRWILERVNVDGNDQWRLESVFVQEPDDSDFDYLGEEGGASPLSAPTEVQTPSDVVQTVMDAIRNGEEQYPYYGAEVAIRYCSPTNAASRLSPQGFSQYLREPWYAILTEWDTISLEEEDVDDDGTVMVAANVKRSDDNFFTIVNWQLSRYSGRWLTDSLTITEGTIGDSLLWTGEEGDDSDEDEEDEYAAFAPDEDEKKRD